MIFSKEGKVKTIQMKTIAAVAGLMLAAGIAGGWFLYQRSGASEAIDETLDVFVPDREEFQRRTSVIDEAQRLRDVINARQTQNIDELD